MFIVIVEALVILYSFNRQVAIAILFERVDNCLMADFQSYFLQWPSACPGAWAPIWLESVGRRDCRRSAAHPDPDFFCAHLVYAGRIKFQTENGIDAVVEPGELFSLWPSVPHHFRAEQPQERANARIDWVRVRGPLAREYLELLGMTPEAPLAACADITEARRIFEELQYLATAYPAGAEQRAVGLLYELAGACNPVRTPAEPRPSVAYKVRDAMAQHFDSGMNVDEYAKMSGVSRSTLFLHFRQTFGKSPAEMLIGFRLQHAKLLLETSELPVAEVGYASGYTDPKYFSRIFARHTGYCPTEFRKRKKR